MLLRRHVKNNHVFGWAGSVCLVVSLLLSRFAPQFAVSDFLQGLFLGLSLVFNLTLLLRWRREHRAI